MYSSQSSPFPGVPAATKTCNSFPCPRPPSAQPTAPLPVQNQTQGLPGTVAVSMNSVSLGSNPTSTILRATHIRSLGFGLTPCSASWPAPGVTHQGGLPGVLWLHLSLLTHHRYGQTIDKPSQSSFAKGPGYGSRWGREPWSPSSKTLAQKSCLPGPALACYKERSHPDSGQDPSPGGHPTPGGLNHSASGCLIYPAHSWLCCSS